jgi:DNA-binding response OmpR family regulator
MNPASVLQNRNRSRSTTAHDVVVRRSNRPLILVVEDNPHDWEIYGKILYYNGFDCMYAPDGATALALAQQQVPDLVLLDLVLPDMSGLDVCRRLKEDSATRGVPIVFLTAQPVESYGRSAKELGGVQYIEKPARPVDVLHVAESLVGRPPPAGEGRPPRVSSGRAVPPA